MNHNPYVLRLEPLLTERGKAEERKKAAETELRWYDSFPLQEKEKELAKSQAELVALHARAAATGSQEAIEAAREPLLAKQAHVPLHLLVLSTLPWVGRPLTPEQVAARAAHKQCVTRLTALRQEKAAAEGSARVTADVIRQRLEPLRRHHAFEAVKHRAEVSAAAKQIGEVQAKIDVLRVQRDALDRQLSQPAAELARCTQDRAKLEGAIRTADDLDAKLCRAQNRYEKAKLHEECGRLFAGESKPHRVREAKQRELAGVIRTQEKLKDRIRAIVERATREVSLVVIDGNNLCYQSQRFIGIHALRALVGALTGKYQVLVVFDGSARSRFQMNDREIAAQLGGARVHVVATGQRADETLLDAAAASTSYVISNDRFRDFPEKAAVRGQRLLRHEVVNDWVYVHDLNVQAALQEPLPFG